MHLADTPWLIATFGIVVVALLALDLGVFNRHSHKVTNREAIIWSIVWIGVAFIFGLVVFFYVDPVDGENYFTAYLIEKALSVDNLFVFIIVFSFFNVPDEYKHRVLFWGVLGALIFRAIFIFSGVWLIKLTYLPEFYLWGHKVHLNLMLTLFGVFLIYAGIKSARHKNDEKQDFSNNLAVRLVRKIFPVTPNFEGDRFFVVKQGVRYATPLFLVLMIIELTDLMFALDSIPAIFAITEDPFVLYTSNIFAIMGLRSLYFLLANFMNLFTYLKYGLAVILVFIGTKMLIMDFYKIPASVSLTIVASVLFISVIVSLIFKPKPALTENK